MDDLKQTTEPIAQIERDFYKEYLLAACAYIRSYLWRFACVAALIALGAWLAFRFMRESQADVQELRVSAGGCAECEERKRRAAELRAWHSGEKTSNP